jgi:hypothetical protein
MTDISTGGFIHLMSIFGDVHFWLFVIVWYLISAAIGALEAPDETSGKFYRYFFRFSHLLVGNLNRAFAGKVPGIQNGATPQN